MRKLILNVAVSLDGFIEGPKGEFDWCFTDQDYGMSAFFKSIDAVFMGRKSYELTQNMKGGAGIPAMKTYVFSNTLKKAGKGVEIVSGDIGSEIEKIKNEEGKDIWMFGGAELTASLMQGGYIDELSMAVHPVLLGSGKPLFSGINGRIKMELMGSTPYSSGLVILKYRILHR